MEDKDWQIKMRKIRAQQEKEFIDSFNENIIKKVYSEIRENISQILWRFNVYISERLTPNRITYVGLMRVKLVKVDGIMTLLEERVYERSLLFGGNTQFVKSFFIK